MTFEALSRRAVRIWALPWTLVGLTIGIAALATGGQARSQGGTVAFCGGAAAAFLRHFPLVRGASAMTFGHVILGQSPADLDTSFEHELVHVRQYERWGPLFVPAYLAASLWQRLHGRHRYWDNPFEREAFEGERM